MDMKFTNAVLKQMVLVQNLHTLATPDAYSTISDRALLVGR